MKNVGVALVCALVGTAASLLAVDHVHASLASVGDREAMQRWVPSLDDEPECTQRADCPWAHVCRWGHCDFIECAPNQSTCQKGEEIECCTGECGVEGGCASSPPNPPSCPGWEVQCGSVCCPYMYACLNPTTGQCGVNY